MQAVKIEVIEHFTDLETNTFVCRGDKFQAFTRPECDVYEVYDHDFSRKLIPKTIARLVTSGGVH